MFASPRLLGNSKSTLDSHPYSVPKNVSRSKRCTMNIVSASSSLRCVCCHGKDGFERGSPSQNGWHLQSLNAPLSREGHPKVSSEKLNALFITRDETWRNRWQLWATWKGPKVVRSDSECSVLRAAWNLNAARLSVVVHWTNSNV